MINLKKVFILTLFLILLILISGCTGKKDVKKSLEELRTGTQSISINFLPFNPPDIITVERDNVPISIVLELQNNGVYPQPDERHSARFKSGNIFLSGYDTSIITQMEPKSGDLSTMALEGKSTINLNGGQDLISFKGTIDASKLNVEKYDPIFLATACYYYETTAGASVCMDPNPYSTINEKKVCEVHDVSLSSQGAPIAVTKIEEQAFEKKTQFKITIKNVGNGDVLKEAAAQNKCNPSEGPRIDREDIDKVYLHDVKISDKTLICGPFASEPIEGTNGLIRLINGEGSIVCQVSKTDYPQYHKSASSFTTPLVITLTYGYRNTAEKKVQIKKAGNLGGEAVRT